MSNAYSGQHMVHVKNEVEADMPYRGLAAIPAMHPEVYREDETDDSFFIDQFGAPAEESTLYHRQLAHPGTSPYQVPSDYVEHRPSVQLPTFSDMQFDAFSTAPSTAWSNVHSSTALPQMQTINPRQADWLWPEESRNLMSGETNTVRTHVNTEMFEAVSDWSRVSADFESLAASSPERETDDAKELATPASSVSQHTGRDVKEGYTVVAHDEKAEGTDHHTTIFPNVTRWRSVDGNVTSLMAIPTPGPSASTPSRTGRGQRAAAVAAGQTAGTGAPSELSEDAERTIKDEFLLTMRDLGLSYKEIKRKGKFREAESTLRGRVRVLTKAKEDRVRKPTWLIGDVKLLRIAVRRHQEHGLYDRPSKDPKIPWKQISAWLSANGASYNFASATCARKWAEIKKN